jgi:hypothetical protein
MTKASSELRQSIALFAMCVTSQIDFTALLSDGFLRLLNELLFSTLTTNALQHTNVAPKGRYYLFGYLSIFLLFSLCFLRHLIFTLTCYFDLCKSVSFSKVMY